MTTLTAGTDLADVRRVAARLVLTALVAVLYAAGWTAGRTVTVTLAAVTYAVAAVRLGWTDAQTNRGEPITRGGGIG